MTDLEKAVARALRLSDAAAEDERMLSEIQRNIGTARAELIRSGVSEESMERHTLLVEDAIITFCLMKMGSEDEQSRYAEAFAYQQDCLRKS